MTGLQAWIIQRVSAVVLASYVFFIFGVILFYSPLDFHFWEALFHQKSIKAFTTLSLLTLIAHAWIGLWTITTDYLKNLLIRFVTQLLIFFSLLFYFFWGLCIIWRI